MRKKMRVQKTTVERVRIVYARGEKDKAFAYLEKHGYDTAGYSGRLWVGEGKAVKFVLNGEREVDKNDLRSDC
jgi:hypothetical protein